MDNDAALDDMIRRLVAARKESKPGEGPPALSREQMTQLCAAASDVLLAEPSLLELEAPIKVCGDVHGQYTDLLRLFDAGGFPPASRYLFLGDYVDRGQRSVDTICLLLAYKVRYPDSFFLIRGNHECSMVNELYGFLDECRRRKLPASLWQAFNSCFNCLPVAALVGGKILCVHGGLSPALDSLDQIRDVARPASVPDQGLLSDLLWSDPAEEKGAKGWCESQRGRSYAFGADVVAGFVEKHGLDLVCRAHQMVRGGYEFFAGGKLVTVFSAPNYCGQCGNDGAIMSVDGSLRCSFEILKPLIPSAWDSDDDELTMTSSVLMLVQYIQAIFSFLRCRRQNTQNLNL